MWFGSNLSRPRFAFCFFCVSPFFFLARICWLFHGKQCIFILFTDSQILIFNNFFIKNGSHDTIHTFKNYFVTVFSVSVTISLIQMNPLCLLGRPLVVASSYWARYSFASTISVQPKVIGPNNPGLWATTPTCPWIWSSHSIGLVFQFSNKQHERKN